MNLETAAKLEGMIVGSRMMLESIAAFVCDRVPEEEREAIALKLGGALAELLYISWALHDSHPSLDPFPEETKLTADLRKSTSADDQDS